jgi:hypothetical protein
MSSSLTRREWRERADYILRLTENNRLDVETLFPSNEHLSSIPFPNAELRENMNKFFNKSLASLTELETINGLLKLSPNDVAGECDRSFELLKKLQHQGLSLQRTIKDFLTMKDKTYSQAKLLYGNLLTLGVTFAEANTLRTFLEQFKRIETQLCCNFMSLEQLAEFEEKLRKEKGGTLDASIEQHIAEKRRVFEGMNSRLMELLSLKSMTIDDLRAVCELVENANNMKFKLSHFRHVCDLRDTFRWVQVLDMFLSHGDRAPERFTELWSKQEEIDLTRNINLENVKEKVRNFIDAMEDQSDLQFFKVLLDPIKEIELTDPSIQAIISLIKSTEWTVIAKHKLNMKNLTREDLEILTKNIETIAKAGLNQTLSKIVELYHLLVNTEVTTRALLQDLKAFTNSLDENTIALRESQLKIEELNKRFLAVKAVYEGKLDCMPSLQHTTPYQPSRALLSILQSSSLIHLRGSLKPWQLNDVGHWINCAEVGGLKMHPLVLEVVDCCNNVQIVQEFMNVMQRHRNPSLPFGEKMEFGNAKRYIAMMNDEESPIDFQAEYESIQKDVVAFEAWESEARSFLEKYPLLSYDPKVLLQCDAYSQLPNLTHFNEDFSHLMSALTSLPFCSAMTHTLLQLKWVVEVASFSIGKKRKRYEWEALLQRGKDFKDSKQGLFKAIEALIKETDRLKSLGHECYSENTSYREIQRLKELFDTCHIDVSEETGFFKERLELQEELIGRLDRVINAKEKYKIADIERLIGDIKISGIDFEDLSQKLENTLMICKAFIASIKEMKKEPGEIKKAKHLYSSLPLYSHSFEAMIKQLEDEERTLDKLNEIFADSTALEDYSRVTNMEQALNQIKFYDVMQSKLTLFKKKISCLMRIDDEISTDFRLPLMNIKSMRLESSEYLKKIQEYDSELYACNRFLTEIESEATNYLNRLSQIATPHSIDQVPTVVIKFIDISSELLDIQAKLKVKSLGGPDAALLNKEYSMRIGVHSKPNLRKFDLNITVPPKQPPPPAFIKKLDQYKEPASTQSDHHRPTHIAHPSQIPTRSAAEPTSHSFHESHQAINPHKVPDILTLRQHLVANLKLEILRNHNLNESEQEAFTIAQRIERAVFTKSLDGSYASKMPKVIRFFQTLVRLKRISVLMSAKAYSIDIVLFLMERSPQVLAELDGDKEKLIKALAAMKKENEGSSRDERTKKSHGERDRVRERHREGREGEREKRRKGASDKRHRRLESDTSSSSSSPKRNLLSGNQGRIRKSRGLDQEILGGLGKVAKSRLTSSLVDNYKIARLRHTGIRARREQTHSPDRANNKFSELSGKTGDKSGDNLARGLQRGGNEKRGEIDIISEDSQREEKDGYRIKRKKSADKNQSVPAAIPSRVALYSDHTSDQNPWSVYKGTLKFEPRNPGFPPLNVDYCDLITVELKSKVSTFPKLPDKIEFKGAIEQAEFASTIDKMIKKPGKNFSYLLGFLKSNENTDSLFKLVTKTNSAFCCKYNPYTKLFLFNKTAFNKSWHEPMEVCSQKIYHALSNFMWLIVINLQTIEKDHPTITTIDPHAIYSQNLFEGFIPQESKLVIYLESDEFKDPAFGGPAAMASHGHQQQVQFPRQRESSGNSFGMDQRNSSRNLQPSKSHPGNVLLNALKFGVHEEDPAKRQHFNAPGHFDQMSGDHSRMFVPQNRIAGQGEDKDQYGRSRHPGNSYHHFHKGGDMDEEELKGGLNLFRQGKFDQSNGLGSANQHYPQKGNKAIDSFGPGHHLMDDIRNQQGSQSHRQGDLPPFRDHYTDLMYKSQSKKMGGNPQLHGHQNQGGIMAGQGAPPGSLLKKRRPQKAKPGMMPFHPGASGQQFGQSQHEVEVSSFEDNSTGQGSGKKKKNKLGKKMAPSGGYYSKNQVNSSLT